MTDVSTGPIAGGTKIYRNLDGCPAHGCRSAG